MSADPVQHYVEQMQRLALVGSALCCYMPGAGNAEKWPESYCDCKFLPDGHDIEPQRYAGSECTGCCEVRLAYRALATLYRAAIKDGSRVI